MGEVVARATEPALAAIKLAWWRERLEELDRGQVPAEPRLQAVAADLLLKGVAGAALARLEDGWAALLDAEADMERVANRGAILFAMASQLLGADDPLLDAAGRLYGLRTATRSSTADEELRQLAGNRFERRLRPLTALAALAARDARRAPVVEPQGTPGRALALLRHRLTGRVA